MSTEVVTTESHAVQVTHEQKDLVKKTICAGATDAEMQLFFFDCQRRGTHPLDKLIHFTKRDGKYTPVTSIDFFRLRAHDSGAYAGEGATTYELAEDGLPDSCTVAVLRLVQGQLCTWRATARWAEYYPGEKGGFMWKKMPFLMLAKCAEALALRKAFPAELQGLYVKEEMDQAGPEQRPLNIASKMLAQSEHASQETRGEDGLNVHTSLGPSVTADHAPATQDAPPSTGLDTYLDQIALSETVSECSRAINAGLADKELTAFDTTKIQDAGKARILALRKK